MKVKTCRDCGQEKTIENFYKKSGRENQWIPYCKPCHLQRGNRNRRINGCKERQSQQYKEWYAANKERKLAYNSKYMKERYHRDPAYKMRMTIGTRVLRAIKKQDGTKLDSVWKYLPYTPAELKEHLESQFEGWMNWQNHGLGEGCWQIDHIIPQSRLPFDSYDHPNFLKCWSLDNLQPLDAIENIKKSDKLLDS